MRMIDADIIMADLNDRADYADMLIKDIREYIAEQPTVEPHNWIPCSERLPEHDNHVLCCTATAKGKKNIIIGYYLHGSDRWASGMNSNVIAWMELPEPYKEEIDETD